MSDPLKDWAREQAIERRAAARQAAGPTAAAEFADGFIHYFNPGVTTALAGYWPLSDEFDVMPLLELMHRRGCALALPAAAAYGAPLQFRRWAPGDALVAGPYGRMQPPPEARTLTPTMSLVPLLAFDRKCKPLTEGHGLYFHMVSALPAVRARGRSLTIGVAFAGQQIDAVPTRVLDPLVDYVITEEGIMQAPPENVPSDAEGLLMAFAGGPL